jgi:hypothetical protein
MRKILGGLLAAIVLLAVHSSPSVAAFASFQANNTPAVDPWLALDGRSNAPAGTPQFATLLNNYVPGGTTPGRYFWPSTASLNVGTGNLQQPPWRVPGVDYAVGLKTNCTVNTSTSVITETGVQSAHINGQQMSFRIGQGGALPSGLSIDTAYFVIAASGSTYQVSLTSGGSAITLGGSPSLLVCLKIPVAATNTMPPGISYATGTFNTVNFSGSANTTNGNVSLTAPAQMTLDSYDFSFNGGLIGAFGYSGPILISNLYCRVGTANIACFSDVQAGSSTNITYQYMEIDGNGPNNVGRTMSPLGYLMYVAPQASSTIKYCWFHNVPTETMSPSGSNVTVEYSVLNNHSYGAQSDHIDTIFPSVTANISGFTHQFNLEYQPVAVFNGTVGIPGEADTSFVMFLQPNNSLTLTSVLSQNNVVIGLGNTHFSATTTNASPAFNNGWDLEPKAGNTITSPNIKNNYVDSSGIESFGRIIVDNQGAGTVTGGVYTGNVSLTTGVNIVANTTGTQ